MTVDRISVIVLAAGKGTRMKSSLPKVMHGIAGRPMILHLLANVAELRPDRVVVVLGKGMDDVAAAIAPATVAVQDPPLGTGHAVRAAESSLRGPSGDILVLLGGDPLTSTATMRRLIAARREAKAAIAVLGMRVDRPHAFGRLVVDAKGCLERIVEARDATPGERSITLCNAGVMAFDGALIWNLLARVGNTNSKHEFYLTDAIGIARGDNRPCIVVESDDPDEVFKVDSRAELAEVEAAVQRQLRRRAMDGGVTLLDPETVTFCHDTLIEPDVVIEPHVVFGPGVVLRSGARIRSFCHLEGADVGPGAIVGPFARLRPGARLAEDAHIGNFVEVKNSEIGRGAKANHLAYVGDTTVGAKVNIGAGTITANYDGFYKHRTEIGAGASIGSNTVLVAPVHVGEGAIVGAGSVITRDVAANAIALARAPQEERTGAAARFRAAKSKRKSKAKSGRPKVPKARVSTLAEG
ncbi:MAG: bifunctional UDP-N-acetylglucosamine diphosphorylase/glucosamine-1-phosphate N-acetyltransferase GlmU [Alphaproteobacteria bacterium]|nr:bifunctional UDP-N-acetylglucosamine diphosphorylase/glucosamine-1-phosphate N-acetyltransferase GlmU [Alphaproteobacteria bacterium]